MRRYNVLPCYRMITLISTENQREFIRQFVSVHFFSFLTRKNRYGVLGRANRRTGSSINGARRGAGSHNNLLVRSSKSSLVRGGHHGRNCFRR